MSSYLRRNQGYTIKKKTVHTAGEVTKDMEKLRDKYNHTIQIVIE